jgi:vesicle coat complex subunit
MLRARAGCPPACAARVKRGPLSPCHFVCFLSLRAHTHTHKHRHKDDNTKDAQNMVILNDMHIDIMDYITPAHCSLLQFRQMWQEFEWENKVSMSQLNSKP